MTIQIVSGAVRSLNVKAGTENFFNGPSESMQFGLAGALAMIGPTGSAAKALGSARAFHDPVEFFSCLVDDKQVRGRFSKVTFRNDDLVRMVVENNGDNELEALAVQRPADQTLWMYPHCSRGMHQHVKYTIRMMITIFFVCIVFGALLLGGYILINSKPVDSGFITFFWQVYLVISMVGSIYILAQVGFKFRRFARKAEGILFALGYPDPRNVDLVKDSYAFWKMTGAKWPILCESDGPWIFRYIAKDLKHVEKAD